MANEYRLSLSLYLKSGNLEWQSRPSAFTFDQVNSAKGPVPGAITVDTFGVDVDLTELTEPGAILLQNLDATNYVEWGLYEDANGLFLPIGELAPNGPPAFFYLSRNAFEDYAGTGTGTTGPLNRLRLKANTASCVVVVSAFER